MAFLARREPEGASTSMVFVLYLKKVTLKIFVAGCGQLKSDLIRKKKAENVSASENTFTS